MHYAASHNYLLSIGLSMNHKARELLELGSLITRFELDSTVKQANLEPDFKLTTFHESELERLGKDR
jgi:hypothetical protein